MWMCERKAKRTLLALVGHFGLTVRCVWDPSDMSVKVFLFI